MMERAKTSPPGCTPHFGRRGLSAGLAALFAFSAVSFSAAGMFPRHPFTDDARGTSAAPFLKVPASARFAAMGQGGAALKAPDAFFYNPAGTAYLPEGSGAVVFSYESLLEDSGRGSIAGLRGIKNGVIGFGAVYRSEGAMKRYDTNGDPAGDFDAGDTALAGSFASKIGSANFGAALKYISSSLAGRAASSFAADVGVLLKEASAKGMQAAFFVRNLGPSLKLGSEPAPLPFELGGALGWNYVPHLGLFIDGRLPSDHSPYIILSGEYSIPLEGGSGIFFRTGMNFKNSEDLGILGVISGGFGVRLKSVGLDYAFVPYGDLGSTHRLTMSMGFGPGAFPEEKKKIARQGAKPSLTLAVFEPGAEVSEVQSRQITDMVEMELMKKGQVRLIERINPDYISAEKKLYYSGLPNKERSLELARRLGARYVLYGDVTKIERGYLVDVKLALAATGEIMASENKTAEDDFLLPRTARELADAISSYY